MLLRKKKKKKAVEEWKKVACLLRTFPFGKSEPVLQKSVLSMDPKESDADWSSLKASDYCYLEPQLKG